MYYLRSKNGGVCYLGIIWAFTESYGFSIAHSPTLFPLHGIMVVIKAFLGAGEIGSLGACHPTMNEALSLMARTHMKSGCYSVGEMETGIPGVHWQAPCPVRDPVSKIRWRTKERNHLT